MGIIYILLLLTSVQTPTPTQLKIYTTDLITKRSYVNLFTVTLKFSLVLISISRPFVDVNILIMLVFHILEISFLPSSSSGS